ncbi:S8 family serine peptidase [Flavitalea antarctica]
MTEKLSPPSGKNGQDPYWYKYISKDERSGAELRRQEDPETQMIVYRSKPDDVTFDQWILWLEGEIEKTGQARDSISIISICGTCNNSLLLLSGQGVNAFVTTEAAVKGIGGSPRPGSTGDELGIYRSANFRVGIPKDLPELKKGKGKNQKLKPAKSNKKPVVVAVLDTGMGPKEPELDKFLVAANEQPCIPDAKQGWNFVADNKIYDDDHGIKHGTTVTRMLVEQCLATKDGNPVKIIPIKVQDGKGSSDLYDVMCAIAYAQSMGANIINASFGYYAPLNYKDNDTYCVKIFREFIKEVLTDNGVLLVAAAGNQTDKEEIKKRFNIDANSTRSQQAEAPDEPRDLDQVHFFPASFAADPELWNVISVTTVTPDVKAVSGTQNFSKKVVDIGVPADEPRNNGFSNPGAAGTFVAGSSFATPKVTGMITANYDLISGKRNKQEIINVLMKKKLLGKVPAKVAVGRAILNRQNGQTTLV